MGLDMYLEAEVYVDGWNHAPAEERERFSRIAAEVGLSPYVAQRSPSLKVSVHVAYWRKANAIHKWFVDNVQGGVDECQRSYVTKEQLADLVSLCKEVLNQVETLAGEVVAQPGIAEKMLPTKDGFFFGNTEYNEYYLDNLRDTIKQIEPLLDPSVSDRVTFYYRASW